MRRSKAERAALIEDLRRIATRLAGAPAYTEANAKAAIERYPGWSGHWPHQVGGLEQVCTSSAADIEAVIRQLGGWS